MQRRLVLAFALLVTGCGFAPPLEPHLVRGSISGELFIPAQGSLFAREDVVEGQGKSDLDGDTVRLGKDVTLDPGLGVAAAIDVSPTDDDELALSYQRLPLLEGTRQLHRQRRFDGAAYGPEDRVSAELDGSRLRAGWTRRVLAVRGAADVDLHVRAGWERYHLSVGLEGTRTAEESRPIRVGAPWVGVEARLRALDHPAAVAFIRVDAGYWNHRRVRLRLADATVGARMKLVGPLFAELGYQVSLRDAAANLGLGEVSRSDLLAHAVSLGLGLSF